MRRLYAATIQSGTHQQHLPLRGAYVPTVKASPGWAAVGFVQILRAAPKRCHQKGIKKSPAYWRDFLSLCWHYLSSRQVTLQVLSAQMSLTSVFGMGTGGPSSQSIPTMSDEVSPILFYVKALLSSNRLFLRSLLSFPFPIQSPAQRV